MELYRAVKERGILIVTERINCHRGTIDSILNQAESGSGIKAARPVSRDRILEESQKMAYADAVFAPSELVGESLIQNGVDRGKILLTSYGIDAQRIRSNISNPTNQKRAVFVGRVGLRKGANLLIDYWRRSNTNSELWFLGKIEPGFSELASKAASDSRIKFKSFVENVDALLKDSSFYVMPSLEEGSPLTTYEAMAAGLPCLVSPMGGGGIVVDGDNGKVLDPYDERSWIDAIASWTSEDYQLDSMSLKSIEIIKNYEWTGVARQRLSLLLEAFG